MTDQPPAAYSDQLHAQASAIADRLTDAIGEIRDEPDAALLIASGPIAMEIAEGAACCVGDQLGLAVMLAAELALRAHAAYGQGRDDEANDLGIPR